MADTQRQRGGGVRLQNTAQQTDKTTCCTSLVPSLFFAPGWTRD